MIKHAIATFVAFLAAYLIGSFIYVDFNLTEWTFVGRIVVMLLASIAAAIAYAINEQLP